MGRARGVCALPGRFVESAMLRRVGGQELAHEGITAVAFPQHDARMVPASAALHAAIVEERITLPDDPQLAVHAAAAIARHGRRGWRIDKPNARTNIDAIIALCMAVDRAQHRPEPVELVGWL